MESDEINLGARGGIYKPGVRRKYHSCLSKKNEYDWVSECPDDCPYFEKK